MRTSLSPADNALLRQLPNPFDDSVVHSADVDRFRRTPHVNSIHESTYQLIFKLLGESRKVGQKSLFVWGEIGSGKTHLIARVTNDLADNPEMGVAIYVHMQEAVRERLWSHLRNCLVKDLMRRVGRDQPSIQLDFLIRAKFPELPTGKQRTQSLIDDLSYIFRKNVSRNPIDNLSLLLQKHCGIPSAVARAISLIFSNNEETQALHAENWLRGDDLTDEQLKSISLPIVDHTDASREEESRKVVLALLRLSSEKLPIVIFYDQLEAFRDDLHDLQGYSKFGKVFTSILCESHCHLLQIVTARTDNRDQIRGSADQAIRDRLFTHEMYLAPLQWEQVNYLLLCRLNAHSDLRKLRHQRIAEGAEQLWPITREYVDRLNNELRHRCTPRILLNECKKEYDRVCQLTVPSPARMEYLCTQLERRSRDSQLEPPQDRLFFVLAGVPILSQLLNYEVKEITNSPLQNEFPDANLIVQTSGQQIWIYSACAYKPQIWQRFRRWCDKWNQQLNRSTRIHRLLLIGTRDLASLPEKTREYLKRLTRLNGVSYTCPSEESAATFYALQRLLRIAASGDLSQDGERIEPVDVLDWAKQSINEPLHPLGVVRLLADALGFDITKLATPILGRPKQVVQ